MRGLHEASRPLTVVFPAAGLAVAGGGAEQTSSFFVNAAMVMSGYQLVYAGLVTLGMAGVFYGIGKLTIGEPLLKAWDVKSADASRESFGEHALIDQPWTRVALLLGAFSAFYFLVHFTHEKELREKVMHKPDAALRRRLAVRATYLDMYAPDEEGAAGRAAGAAHAVARRVRHGLGFNVP